MDGLEFGNRHLGLAAQPKSTQSSSLNDGVAGRVEVDLDRAIESFEEETDLPPTPDDSEIVAHLMRNASILMAAGEGRLAFNILRNVLIRQPENAEALRRMGVCLREADRPEEALKCFRAFNKIAKSLESQILVADTLYLCERDELALPAYREALKFGVNDERLLFDIYKNVGNIFVRACDFEGAEEFYDKAYTLNPNSDVLLVNYGTLEIQRGSMDKAVDRFRRAVEVNPQSDRAWVGLAMVHRAMGDLELAKGNLERALDINASNRTALKLAVEWAIQDSDTAPALRRLETYVSTSGGEDAEICFIFAKLLIQAGRLSQARLELERVLALDPGVEGGEALVKALDRELGHKISLAVEKDQGTV